MVQEKIALKDKHDHKWQAQIQVLQQIQKLLQNFKDYLKIIEIIV